MPSAGRYNLTISHQQKFIWFRVAKVGTRTILNHFKQCEISLDVEHASWLHYPNNLYDSYYKFAFVRNPWDRLVSCWRNKVINENYFKFNNSDLEKMKSFENFVNHVSSLNIYKCDRHLRSQSKLIDINMIDYLGRLETFEDDLNQIFDRIGLPNKKIVQKNATSRTTNYKKYYSEELVEKVAKIYSRDIQIFGYQF